MTRAPDVAGEIVAWRAWRVDFGWRTVTLRSITNDTPWPTDGWLHALCRRRDLGVPHDACSCGVYAARDRAHLVSQNYHLGADVVIGEVGLAGRVIPATQGYRAEKARPLRIFLPYLTWARGAAIRSHYPMVKIVLNRELSAQGLRVVADTEAA